MTNLFAPSSIGVIIKKKNKDTRGMSHLKVDNFILKHCLTYGVRGGTVGWGTAGSIPDGVIGIFHCYNPSGRTMALRLTQPQTEMSTRNFVGGKAAGG